MKSYDLKYDEKWRRKNNGKLCDEMKIMKRVMREADAEM